MPMAGRRLNMATGRIELTDQQKEYLDFLLGERAPGDTEQAFADRIGRPYNTIRKWKVDKAFLEEWEHRLRKTHSHPQVISAHLEALDKKGRGGDVQAIKLYHDIVEKMWPQRQDAGPEDLAAMSDVELLAAADAMGFLRDRAERG